MDARRTQAIELMLRFAERTGLTGDHPQRRYLWTDAFAVCTFLALDREDLARRTIERVHHTLGRFRDDDARIGWISGLPGDEGAAHPTRWGLRIGKPLPERGPGDPFSERLEWERDGQYFHYLTKWMHALDVMARATGDADYDRWARELAIAAHRGFVYEAGGAKRMYWKTSVDLTRPVVPAMGHHDPLDGFITAVQLGDLPPALLADYGSMIQPGSLATSDPLGLGGLLADACRVHQLVAQDAWVAELELLDPLLDAALVGLRHYLGGGELDGAIHHRLAFRELGLSIGLAGIEHVLATARDLPRTTAAKLDELAELVPLRAAIERVWLDPDHRREPAWRGHADINDVMLATALVPSGFLILPSRSRRSRPLPRASGQARARRRRRRRGDRARDRSRYCRAGVRRRARARPDRHLSRSRRR